MENPHAERQAVLLERILKNTSKCTETILELNHYMEVSRPSQHRTKYPPAKCFLIESQSILRENSQVKTAADLATKYRRNVQYNLEATRGDVSEDKTPTEQ
ncbi:hypothetical protein DFH07DRAFT_963487 [Mycena maculata]|uniref:DASH complex subunit DAD4 n=1 Tax=Mycena maculata TaxID=230809 RepID=A0AAD7N489_9AGAR|nr:hypothetical protein DFH07DRAFT_963487 [Mycena maculata]